MDINFTIEAKKIVVQLGKDFFRPHLTVSNVQWPPSLKDPELVKPSALHSLYCFVAGSLVT